MWSIAQRELIVLLASVTIFIILLIPSLLSTRAEVRDGLRKQDITHLKRSLENFYNLHEYYPATPNKQCLISNQPEIWTFTKSMPHDLREKQGHLYRYCPTQQNNQQAIGYFLEAQFERSHPNQTNFDEDEQRKFHYRILNENNKTLYRVCGGKETQCNPKSK